MVQIGDLNESYIFTFQRVIKIWGRGLRANRRSCTVCFTSQVIGGKLNVPE